MCECTDGGNKAFRTVERHNFRSFRDRILWRQCVLGTAIPDATDPENTTGITVLRQLAFYSSVCLYVSRSVLPPTCDYLEVPEGVEGRMDTVQ